MRGGKIVRDQNDFKNFEISTMIQTNKTLKREKSGKREGEGGVPSVSVHPSPL